MLKKISNILKIIVIALILFSTKEIYAANYELKELIPKNEITSVRGDTFLYKDVRVERDKIKIGKIKNLSDDDHAITVTIGLFDKEKINIGIINYCTTNKTLKSKEEIDDYVIDINDYEFKKDFSYRNIKYISILSENLSCRLGGSKEYIGKKIDSIYRLDNNALPPAVNMLLTVLKVIAIILFILFVYKYLFTSAYRNMNGEDIRNEYQYKNKIQKEQNANKPQPEKKVETNNKKTKEIIEQEKAENDKGKDNSDLHDFYK